MANYKRKKPRFNKLYRNGIDGVGCGYCGSNWTFSESIKTWLIEWESNQ